MKTFAGIEIGGTKLQIIIGDEQANILQRFRFPVDKQAGAEGIRRNIRDTFASLDPEQIRGIGVGFGGPVDYKTGKVFTSYHIDGWTDFPLTNWLCELTGIFVSADNDANVAALGEALFGAGRNYDSVYYVTVGSGLGAGMVIDKRLYHGASPGEMEMGHIRLDKSGRTLQSSCAGWAVDEKMRQAIRKDPKGILAGIVKKETQSESRFLLAAIDAGDETASEIFESTMDDFAFGLSHGIHLLHPQTVIIGGGLSLLGEPLRKMTEQKLQQYLMDAFTPGPDIQLSKLKEDAVPVGALALAIQQKQ